MSKKDHSTEESANPETSEDVQALENESDTHPSRPDTRPGRPDTRPGRPDTRPGRPDTR